MDNLKHRPFAQSFFTYIRGDAGLAIVSWNRLRSTLVLSQKSIDICVKNGASGLLTIGAQTDALINCDTVCVFIKNRTVLESKQTYMILDVECKQYCYTLIECVYY